jgi:hypothetical protein
VAAYVDDENLAVEPYDVETLLLVLGDIREDVTEIRKILEEDDGEETEENS